MENASLSRLIDRTAESISAGVLKETKLLMTQLDEQSQHIRKLRNKRLAHSDYSEVLRLHNEPLPGIGTQQIEDIIAKITKIFSLLEGQFLESETVFRGTTPSQPATSILWALRKSLKYNDIEKLVLTGQFGLTND